MNGKHKGKNDKFRQSQRKTKPINDLYSTIKRYSRTKAQKA